jgi:GAF domain-containing protein
MDLAAGRQARLSALLDAIHAVSSGVHRDLDAVLDLLAERARALLGADGVALHVADHATGELMQRRPNRLAVPGSPLAAVGVGYRPDAFVVEAVAAGRPLFTSDFQADPRIEQIAKESLPSAVARMVVPLVADGVVEGVLFANWTRPYAPSAEELEIAQALGEHAAVALRTARLLEETRRARAEAEEAHAELAAVFEGVDDGLVIFDAEGRVVHTSRWTREQLLRRVGRVPTTVAEVRAAVGARHPDGRPVEELPAEVALRVGEPHEAEMIYDGGRRLYVRATPVRDASGRVWAAVSISRDITELHNQIEARAQLDGAIKTARLISHELNNQLAYVAGYGELLAAEVEGRPAELTGLMVGAAHRAAEIVRRLQRIVRFEETESAVGPMLDLDAAVARSEAAKGG